MIDHFSGQLEERGVVEIEIELGSGLFGSDSGGKGGKILYKGAAHAYTSPPPHSLYKILSAPSTSFSVDSDALASDKSHVMIVDTFEKGGEGLWAGSGMGVVSGFISNGGARIGVVGGVEVFSDGFVNRLLSS